MSGALLLCVERIPHYALTCMEINTWLKAGWHSQWPAVFEANKL